MARQIRLFQIGQRGVDVVNKPQDIDESELVRAQNVEVATSKGGGALDQRPGMTRIGNNPMAGSIAMALDVPVELAVDGTPTLLAGLYTGSTHNWRTSTDGTTWTNNDSLTKPFSNVSNVAYFKNFPKCVTIGKFLYWVDASMNVRQWDGSTDSLVSAIPQIAYRPVMPSSNASVSQQGTPGATTYTYALVPILGGSIYGASLTLSTTTGNATLNGTNFNRVQCSNATNWTDVTSVDVYRTVGGPTQGKIGTITFDTTVSFVSQILDDKGLAGDSASVPAATTSVAVVTVLDMTSDGSNLLLSVLDTTTDPRQVGRLLSLNPKTSQWTQQTLFEGRVGNTNQLSSPTIEPFYSGLPWGNGTGATAMALDGGYVYGTYIGSTNGNTSYIGGVSPDEFAGGIPEIHTNASSVGVCSVASFAGNLYFGCASLVAGTAAAVIKRTGNEPATYSTVESGPATAALNAFTQVWTFNGKLYAGWTSGGGATAARIRSTSDGTTWATEITLNTTEVVCQAVTFGTDQYVVLGKTGAAYNTATRILKCTSGGVWSEVDNPSDKFAGNIGIVYV